MRQVRFREKKTSMFGPVNLSVFCLSTLKKCFPASVLPLQLIWIPPRTTCGPSGQPSPCLLVSVGHQTGGGGRADAPAGSSSGNVLFRSTSSTTMSSRMVSACSAWPGLAAHTRDDRPRQNSSCHPGRPGRPTHSSRYTRRRRAQQQRYEAPQNSRRPWVFDISCHWRTERQWSIPQCQGSTGST